MPVSPLATSPTRGPAGVARRAETTASQDLAPPPEELEKFVPDNTNFKRLLPKREIPWTLNWVRRMKNEEAQRFRPIIEPLLKKRLSVQELTFILNRRGAELRPLLFRPRAGLPVFTQQHVSRICALAKTPQGRLNKWLRPKHLPPLAPGALYPAVPPLKPWSPSGESAAGAEEAEEPEAGAEDE